MIRNLGSWFIDFEFIDFIAFSDRLDSFDLEEIRG